MPASLLDGKAIAKTIQQTIYARVQQSPRAPGLAVILLGDDPASRIYVENKHKACLAVGYQSYVYHLAEKTTSCELFELIHDLNASSEVDGILVQLPLPLTIPADPILEAIHPSKDVDGFHPYNIGRLALREPLLRPCTPYGIMQLLHAYQLPIQGKHAVVIGASRIVGRPMALEFLLAGATVTICHRSTQHLEAHVRMADILVIATGEYNAVKPKWLHSDQIVIDVGIHRQKNGKLHGDIDFSDAFERVKWITPVPGGVGPMTIATLLQNTLLAASIRENH